MTKEEKNIYAKQYRIKNADKIKAKEAIIREINREYLAFKSREYHNKNKKQCNIRSKNRRNEFFGLWKNIIPNEVNCEVCGKNLILASGNQENSIHFDHKKPNLPIQINPSIWLSNHRPNEKNIQIWKSCNFGMICRKCNLHLPTDNREEFIKQAVKYVLGMNI